MRPHQMPPEPFNLITVVASLLFLLWCIRLFYEAKRIMALRLAMLTNRVVRVRGCVLSALVVC